MTIERATGIRFDLPQGGFSGSDIAAIIFIYRAIVDRAFTYQLINGLPIVIEADEEGAKRLRSLQGSRVIGFGPEEMSRPLLGVEIPLGTMTVKILDPYIVEIACAKRLRRAMDILLRCYFDLQPIKRFSNCQRRLACHQILGTRGFRLS
jgi:hypothetical protein